MNDPGGRKEPNAGDGGAGAPPNSDDPNRAADLTHQLRANGDVPHQIALDGIFGGDAVRQLLQLADVVKDRPGDEQVTVGAVGPRQERDAVDDLENVFEQPAAIRVVHRLCRRPDAQAIAVLRQDPRQQLT